MTEGLLQSFFFISPEHNTEGGEKCFCVGGGDVVKWSAGGDRVADEMEEVEIEEGSIVVVENEVVVGENGTIGVSTFVAAEVMGGDVGWWCGEMIQFGVGERHKLSIQQISLTKWAWSCCCGK